MRGGHCPSGYSNTNHVFATSSKPLGEVVGVTPKKKQQRGFHGFYNDKDDHPHLFSLTNELVRIGETDYKLLTVERIHREGTELHGVVWLYGKRRKVQKLLVQNPNLQRRVEFRGIARIWHLV